MRLLASSSITTSNELLPKPNSFKWNIVNRLCSFHRSPSVISTPKNKINTSVGNSKYWQHITSSQSRSFKVKYKWVGSSTQVRVIQYIFNSFIAWDADKPRFHCSQSNDGSKFLWQLDHHLGKIRLIFAYQRTNTEPSRRTLKIILAHYYCTNFVKFEITRWEVLGSLVIHPNPKGNTNYEDGKQNEQHLLVGYFIYTRSHENATTSNTCDKKCQS